MSGDRLPHAGGPDPNSDEDLLFAYLDGSLDAEGRADFARRLQNEPDFADRLALHARVESMLGSFGREEADAERAGLGRVASPAPGAPRVVGRRVHGAAAGARLRASRAKMARLRTRFVVAAAAALIGGLAYFHLGRRSTREAAPVPGLAEAPRSAPAPSPAAPVARVRSILPDGEGSHARVARDGASSFDPLSQGDELFAGDRIVAESSGVEFAYLDEATTVNVVPGGVVRLTEDGRVRRVTLEDGSLRAEIEKRPPDRAIVFVTPHAEATVIGTTLALAVGAGSTSIEVEEGLVRFTRTSDRASVDVAAGHSARAADGVRLAARPVARVVDDFEGDLVWRGTTWSDASDVAVTSDRARSGGHSLRIRYRFRNAPAGEHGYSSIVRPIALEEGDAYIGCRILVEQTDFKTGINCQLTMDDGSAWFMGRVSARKLPRGEWAEFRVVADAPLKKNNAPKGGDVYDPSRVVTCVIGVHGGNATIYLDDLTLSARPLVSRGAEDSIATGRVVPPPLGAKVD